MSQSLKDILRSDITNFQYIKLVTTRHIQVYQAKKALLKLLTSHIEQKDTNLLPNEFYKRPAAVDNTINNLLNSGFLDRK